MALIGTTKKEQFLKALSENMGNITAACNAAKIPRRTHYNWYSTDEEYRRQVDEMREIAIDYAEQMLFKQMENGSPASTIFFLKTIGRRRGYVEHDRQTDAVNTDKLETAFDIRERFYQE